MSKQTMTRRNCLQLVAGAAATGSALYPAIPAVAQGAAAADWDNVVKRAKEEGVFTLYTAATENVIKRTSDAFGAKYGIKCQFLRLSSNPLRQRYFSEAEAGNIAADVILNAGDAAAFAREGIAKGWIEPLTSAKLPAITSGEFPQKWNRNETAIVQIGPWLIVYNTDLVKTAADAPKDWDGLLDPKWKGRMVVINPASSDAYLDLWALVLDRFGPSFFTRLRAQELRLASAGNMAIQSLAAGEVSLAFPQIPDSARIIKNAPVGLALPQHTTGVEIQLFLSVANKSAHPNAARLFANYILTKEGNEIMNADPDSAGPYNTTRLPANYESPKPETAGRKAEILKLFGQI